jgi:hypothetical protein
MYITAEITAHIEQIFECFFAKTLLYLEAPNFSIGADFNPYM